MDHTEALKIKLKERQNKAERDVERIMRTIMRKLLVSNQVLEELAISVLLPDEITNFLVRLSDSNGMEKALIYFIRRLAESRDLNSRESFAQYQTLAEIASIIDATRPRV